MVAKLIRAIKRALLANEINVIEADLAGIQKQRANDAEVERMLIAELSTARRRLFVACQDELARRK